MVNEIRTRAKDAPRVHGTLRLLQVQLNEELAEAIERKAMEADVAAVERLAEDVEAIEADTADSGELVLNGSTAALEEVARRMLNESIEAIEASGLLEPPEWDSLNTALKDAAWWAEIHEEVYRAEVERANREEVSK